MTAPAILTGWLYLPLSRIGGEAGAARLRTRLLHKPRWAAPDAPPLRLYSEDRSGYLGVPREWGLKHYAHLGVDDQTSLGGVILPPRRPNPNHPRVQDPEAQAKFMADLLAVMQRRRSFVAMAPTGSGKTVCALNTAAEIGRRTLILVHLQRLAAQWREQVASILGVPENLIGIVQQDKCEWQDKWFSVGILHSVAQRAYDPAFYSAFGMVIYDEVHKVGSEFFAPAVSRFSSRYRLGLSATPNRKDGGDRVIFYHLGPIRVASAAEALPMRVAVKDYDCGDYPLYGVTKGSRVKCLTKDQWRNRMLAGIIRQFYQRGRNALIVSDSVMHLQALMVLAHRLGVPASAMGQYTSEVHRVMGVRNPDGTRARGEDGKPLLRLVKIPQKDEALDRVKTRARLVFATYGMIVEGIDEARWDAGLDATPRGDAAQLIGRLRRPLPGKPRPVWVTIRDRRCAMSERWFEGRCKDYHATGAEVVRYGTQASGTH